MSNNKNLSYYIRLDQAGRKIAGSGVWRSKKPSIGRWFQESIDTCCVGGGTTDVTVAPDSGGVLTTPLVTILCDSVAMIQVYLNGQSSTDIDNLVVLLNTSASFLGIFTTDETNVTLALIDEVSTGLCSGTLTMTITGS